jgi:hypothetical protein
LSSNGTSLRQEILQPSSPSSPNDPSAL